MKCPYCYSMNTHVVNTILLIHLNKRRRYYKCKDCGKNFTTFEDYDPKTLKRVLNFKLRENKK